MAIPIALAALAAAPYVYQGVQGIRQGIKGGKIKPKRPDYQIAPAMTNKVGMYRNLAANPMLPGFGRMADQQSRATASGIGTLRSASGSSQDLIAGASGMVGNQNRALGDLAIAGAQNQQRNQQLYGQSLSEMARYQDQAFNINKMMPYLNDVREKEALIAASQSNIYGSLSGLADVGMGVNKAGGIGGGGGTGTGDLAGIAKMGGAAGTGSGAAAAGTGTGAAAAGSGAAALPLAI